MTNQPIQQNEIDRLFVKLKANQAVEVKKISKLLPRQAWPDTLRQYPDLLVFYQQVDEVKISWRVKVIEEPDHCGGLEIISSRYFDDGKTPISLSGGEFWMVNNEERVLIGKFYPIELIEDNAAVGVFAEEGIPKEEVFFFDFGINFYSLKTDWPGYLKLLEMSWAVRYWQTAIIQWEYGETSVEVENFEKILKLISADMNLNDFKAFYNTVKRMF
jgi:hypothetical protein